MTPAPWEIQSSGPKAPGLHNLHPGARQKSSGETAPSSARSATQQSAELKLAIGRFLSANPIIGVLEERLGQGTLRRVARAGGGEWSGPCPDCGGRDRLRVWPSPVSGVPRAWCRQCNARGDALHWAALLAGHDPRVAGSIAATLREAGYLDDADRGRGRRNRA
jgi:hypothetical protein